MDPESRQNNARLIGAFDFSVSLTVERESMRSFPSHFFFAQFESNFDVIRKTNETVNERGAAK